MQVPSPAFSCFRARFSGGSSGQIFPFGESQQGAITSAMSNMVAPARPASGTTTRRPTRRSDPTRHVPAMLKACPKNLGKVGKAKRAQRITVCCKCPRPDRHCERAVEGPALLLSVNVASAQYSSGVDTELISSPGQTPTGASTDVGLDSPHCPEPGHVCPRPVRDRPPPLLCIHVLPFRHFGPLRTARASNDGRGSGASQIVSRCTRPRELSGAGKTVSPIERVLSSIVRWSAYGAGHLRARRGRLQGLDALGRRSQR